jgi:hypothetical protein
MSEQRATVRNQVATYSSVFDVDCNEDDDNSTIEAKAKAKAKAKRQLA